ncbi:MAG: N-acetylglucosamine-6-phosphate deacetylase [Ilumatobacteraceae bacterium]
MDSASSSGRCAVRAGRVILDGGSIGPATIMIDEGRIDGIEPGHPTVDRRTIGDGSDVVAAGLIDVHTHGAAGVQVIDGDPHAMRDLASFYAAHGVTSFLATIGGSDGSIRAGIRAVTEGTREAHPRAGARCRGIHLEGPFINGCRPGAFDPDSIVAPDRDLFDRYVELAGGHVRHITLAPEVPGAEDVIARARHLGITVAAGHSAATAHEFLDAIELGVGSVTHLFNAMSPLHHREPGVIGVALTDHRITSELIADGVHVAPRTIDVVHRSCSTRRIALITDSIAAAGLPDGTYRFEEQEITVSDGQARLADGTLAGSTVTLDLAVRNFASFAGIAWDEAIVSATATPADMIGLAHSGRIAVGGDGDLVGFSDDGHVRWTMVAGMVVHGEGS